VIELKGRNEFYEGWIAGIVSPLEDPPDGRLNIFKEGWKTAKESSPQIPDAEALHNPDALKSLGTLLLGLRETIRRKDDVRMSVTNPDAW